MKLRTITVAASLLIVQMAGAFETGKFECVSEKAGANGEKAVAVFTLSKVNLKTDLGEVTLPYMEYSFDDKNGYSYNVKGVGQISGESFANNPNWKTVQIDSHGFKVVFDKGKVQSTLGECHSVK